MTQQITNFWCVGRNYADHAKELGNAVPTSPMIFLKSGSCQLAKGEPARFPEELGPIHHEVELAVQFDSQLKLTAMTVALDLTARDKQNELKKQGHPWTLAKSFKNSCFLGEFLPIQDLEVLQKTGEIFLSINGRQVQHGLFSDMIFSVGPLAEYVKRFFPVRPYDVLLTGTPAGVGPLGSGDVVEAWTNTIPKQKWTIA